MPEMYVVVRTGQPFDTQSPKGWHRVMGDDDPHTYEDAKSAVFRCMTSQIEEGVPREDLAVFHLSEVPKVVVDNLLDRFENESGIRYLDEESE